MSNSNLARSGAYDDAAGFLSGGIDSLFALGGNEYALIDLDQIEVKEQIREAFEDEHNTLEDLASSIQARGVLQPVLLRPLPQAGYELVAGERRFRAAKLAGLTQIPAVIKEMTDEEAEDAQLAENIHRKNLTQIEEAKKIQRDLDRLGSTEAVLAKHHKSKAWLSKTLSLLSLPGQAKRLVTEDISADIEIINAVKGIEKIDPAAAQELVDDLKESRGKAKPGKAREKVEAVKSKLKPGLKGRSKGKTVAPAEYEGQTGVGEGSFAYAKQVQESLAPVSAIRILDDIFRSFSQPLPVGGGMDGIQIYKSLTEERREMIHDWLHAFHDMGGQGRVDNDAVRTIRMGFRQGTFSTEGYGAFALASFLSGLESREFDVSQILLSVKD